MDAVAKRKIPSPRWESNLRTPTINKKIKVLKMNKPETEKECDHIT
jgi:hypothetical protein